MGKILKELNDGILTISFNRPDVHNALDDDMGAQFHDVLEYARKEKKVKVIILRGEGNSFCSGRDFREMGQRPPGVTHFDYMTAGQEKIKMLLALDKPLLASVKGAALGAGCEYAMVADIRIAAPTAKFSLPEVNYGLAVDQGGSALAASLIGPSKTKWMLMTGGKVEAKTALDWGLIDFMVSEGELDQFTREMAEKIAAKPQRAVLAAKNLVNEIWASGVEAAIRRELTQQLALFASEDFLELRKQRQEKFGAAKAAS